MRSPGSLIHGTLILSIIAWTSLAIAEDAWLVAPASGNLTSASDREAREELLKVILAKQAETSREGWALKVPERNSGVPAKYDLLLHRSNGCFLESRARLKIQVRDGQAEWELWNLSGIYRAERSAKDIDRLVRIFAYAFHAVENTSSGRFSTSHSIGPPPVAIEVVSRDDRAEFHLQTPYLDANWNSTGPPQTRIRNYAFATLVEHAFDVAKRECQPLSKDDEANEILSNLRGMPATTKADSLAVAREPQIHVESSLLADRAVGLSLRDALPELKRLSLVEQERQLSVASAANPRPLIMEAIARHFRDERLATWAVRFAAGDEHPERLQWLIDVLPRLEKDPPRSHRASSIVAELARKSLSEEQLAQLRARFDETKNLEQKASLANLLLQHTRELKYFQHLETTIRDLPPGKNDSDSLRREAIRDVLEYAIRSGNQRQQARALLKAILREPRDKENPDSFEMFELVEFLGDLGTSEDVPYLAGLAQSKSPYLARSAIQSLAKLDAKRALEILHARIQRWNQRPADELTYSHEVYPHFALIIFERDQKAAPLLKTAWQRLSSRASAKQDRDESDSGELTRSGYNPGQVIAFLEAKSGTARAEAAIAHFGDRAHYEDPKRMQKLVDQLIAEGAAPERCKVLLSKLRAGD